MSSDGVKIKFLVLSLTGKCNFACKYCYASEHDQRQMSAETALRSVKLAAESGERFIIQFSGGEPLLNFECLQTVTDWVREHNINADLRIQTNASLLTDAIAAYLYKNKIAIGVSLDGRPAVNDKLRLTSGGDGATGSTVRGINVLRQNNILCGITCVVTEENVDELPGVVEFAYFLGNVRRLGFDLLRGQGRGAGLAPPTEAQMNSAMEKVFARNDALSVQAGYKIGISQQERAEVLRHNSSYEFGHCYAMNGEAAFVDAKGDIYSCSSLIGNEDFYIGNVTEGIAAEKVQSVRRRIREAMLFCRHCRDFSLCGGGCFARWYGSGRKQAYESECALKCSAIRQILKCK